MLRIALLNNPASRKNRRNPGLAANLAEEMGALGRRFDSKSLAELDALAAELHRLSPQLLAINGGDGTLSRVLGALSRQYQGEELPEILLLRGGTMNTVAGGLGLRGDPLAILGRACALLRAGQELPSRRIGLLTAGDQCGMIFGQGCFHNFIDRYARVKQPTPGRGFLLLLKTLSSLLFRRQGSKKDSPELSVSLTIDGNEMEFNDLAGVAASTTAHIGFGFRPFYLAEKDPARFHLLLLRHPLSRVLSQLPALYRGRARKGEQLLDFQASEVKLRWQTPMPIMIDGELHEGTDELTLRTEQSVRFIVI